MAASSKKIKPATKQSAAGISASQQADIDFFNRIINAVLITVALFLGLFGLFFAYIAEAPFFGDYSRQGTQLINKIIIIAFMALVIYFGIKKKTAKILIFLLLILIMDYVVLSAH